MSAPSPALKRTLARSYSGAFLDLAAPDWRDVNLSDVALALAGLNRWNAHCSRPVSVLEHSQVVAALTPPRLRLAARLHDGQEYMTGDGTRPYVETLALRLGPAIKAEIDRIKYDIDVAICRQLFEVAGVRLDDADLEARQLASEMRSPVVKAADDAAAKIEERAFWGGQVARASEHYGQDAPDLRALQTLWLDMAIEECRARFGCASAPVPVFAPAGTVTITPAISTELRAAEARLQEMLDGEDARLVPRFANRNARDAEDGA